MTTQPIFTQQDIDGFKFDTTKYNLSFAQLLPVILKHVADKNENFNIKTYNINKTVEIIGSFNTNDELFKYMQNKLNKYEATKNEQAVKSKIQEQVQG